MATNMEVLLRYQLLLFQLIWAAVKLPVKSLSSPCRYSWYLTAPGFAPKLRLLSVCGFPIGFPPGSLVSFHLQKHASRCDNEWMQEKEQTRFNVWCPEIVWSRMSYLVPNVPQLECFLTRRKWVLKPVWSDWAISALRDCFEQTDRNVLRMP